VQRLSGLFLWTRGRYCQLLWRLGYVCLLSWGFYSYSQNNTGVALANPVTKPTQQTIPPTTPTQWLPLIFRDYHAAMLTSPNGNIRLHFYSNRDSATPALAYTLTYAEQPILRPSALALALPTAEAPLAQFAITNLTFATVNQTYAMPFGEAATVHDQYNEMVVDLRETTEPQRELQLIFRAYNGAIALRYHIPTQAAWTTFALLDEQTHFTFPADHLAYVEYGTEGEYLPQPLSAITGRSENPLTLVGDPGLYLAITEAAVDNYPRMVLQRDTVDPQTLVTSLESAVQATTPYTTPWRVLMLAESPAALLAQSSLLYQLSPPTQYTNTSWIRPGKAMRSGLSTEAARQTIDFAAAHGIDYIEFDAGWYGPEFDPNSDATQAITTIDMPQVLAYAAKQERGVFLYVNRLAAVRQLDTLLPLYASWGVVGIKFGYLDGRTQAGIQFIHEAVRKAADYQLLVNVHDNYRPSGLSRTYPNLVTQEGVRGNEHFAGATHNVTLPFTRFLAGAADYTFPYYVDRLTVTRAHQLAAMVAFFSPLQFVFWYDSPVNYQGEPEIAWVAALPTVWDETRVLDGQIGETISIARRQAGDWFVGVLTNQEPRSVLLPLTFLEPEQRYQVTRYSDQTPTRVAIETMSATMTDILTVTLLPSGGAALHFIPIEGCKPSKDASLSSTNTGEPVRCGVALNAP